MNKKFRLSPSGVPFTTAMKNQCFFAAVWITAKSISSVLINPVRLKMLIKNNNKGEHYGQFCKKI